MHNFYVVHALRERLIQIGFAETLFDVIEGPHPEARKAAVLLPLFERCDTLHLAFIKRASTLRTHSGEIALPGGKADPTDCSLIITALREAQEEIGLNLASSEVLGLLPAVFTATNYLIIPVVVFFPEGLGILRLQKSEVAELIIAPLRELSDPAIAHTEQWEENGKTHTVYFYNYQSHCIWGATGRILFSFLDIFSSVNE